MILIGQYDSPFVRRVGIAMTLYGLVFEHRPWSVFGDAEKIRAFSPLTRVPTLVLEGGDYLGLDTRLFAMLLLFALVVDGRRRLHDREHGTGPGVALGREPLRQREHAPH